MNIAIITVLCLVAAAVVAFITYTSIRKHNIAKRVEAQTGVKVKRRTFKEWLLAHIPSKRRLIQVYATLLYNANIKGFISGDIYTSATTKYLCVPGLNCYSCPGAVGACPLGALQNALAASAARAPFYVFGIIGIFGLIFARTICGWLCPIGLGQELLYKIRTPKLKKSRVTRILSYFKYVLLVALVIIIPLSYGSRNVAVPGFCKYICPAGTLGGAIGLLANPSNSGMFAMLGGLFTWKFTVLVACAVASIFIFRFFCRFFCPLGAIYGFFNRIALLGVKVDKENCTDCGKCVRECKMDVARVGDHECINCGECIPVCPTKAIRWKGSKLFLHKSETATAAAIKPLAVTNGTITVNQELPAQTATENPTTASAKESASEVRDQKVKKYGAGFWIQLTAWILALLLLAGAIVFYNFIDVEKDVYLPPPDQTEEDIGYDIGQYAPDFTVSLYGSDESFTLKEHRGKLTVINFWATWCGPCVTEIPYFNELSKRDDVYVIAIHGSSTDDVNAFIENNWAGHSLAFAQDNLSGTTCLTFRLLGGRQTWPLTVIVDADGKVVYNSTQSFHSYEDLENLVNGFLNA